MTPFGKTCSLVIDDFLPYFLLFRSYVSERKNNVASVHFRGLEPKQLSCDRLPKTSERNQRDQTYMCNVAMVFEIHSSWPLDMLLITGSTIFFLM
jgi:hypothetical protein